MTYQEKVVMLESYQENTQRLQGLAEEAERWRQIATSTAINADGMPHGSTEGGKVQNAAINAADIVAEINKDIADVKSKRDLVKGIIATSGNRRHRLLLEQRYIYGLPVYEIANINGKSEKWTRESIKKAVNTLNCK